MRNHFIWAEMSYVTTERKVVMSVSLEKKKKKLFPADVSGICSQPMSTEYRCAPIFFGDTDFRRRILKSYLGHSS